MPRRSVATLSRATSRIAGPVRLESRVRVTAGVSTAPLLPEIVSSAPQECPVNRSAGNGLAHREAGADAAKRQTAGPAFAFRGEALNSIVACSTDHSSWFSDPATILEAGPAGAADFNHFCPWACHPAGGGGRRPAAAILPRYLAGRRLLLLSLMAHDVRSCRNLRQGSSRQADQRQSEQRGAHSVGMEADEDVHCRGHRFVTSVRGGYRYSSP